MFFSEAILSRRGPLAKVWLAAHMERKLSKTQTLQADIAESVGAIVGQEVEVMALRLSGQLLLGVVRIYSRKTKYLLDDCNEALLKIKMAFRPGMVDMTEDQLAVNRNAITLPENNIDMDLLLPDINWNFDFEDRPQQPQGQHVARAADITLASANDITLDLDDPGYGFDLEGGIGSQDFDVDLGIDFGDGPVGDEAEKSGQADETMSVEVGRDAAPDRSARESLGSHLLGGDGKDLDAMSHRSREMSEHPFGADMDMDFGPDIGGMDIDLGLDFGDGPSGGDITMGEASAQPEKEKSVSRASSPLTSAPPSPRPEDPNEATEKEGEDKEATPKKRKYTNKKQIIDKETELAEGPGVRRNGNLGSQAARDVSDITTEQHFLPRSRSVMRLLEIRRDPLAHFLPTKVTPNGTFFCAAPPGLAPELAEMFMRPIFNILTAKKRGASPEKGANKKARLDKDAEDEVEQARRAGSQAPSVALGSEALHRGSVGPDMDFGGDAGMDMGMGMGMDDFQFDVDTGAGMDDMQELMDRERAKSKSRLSTPAADGELFDEAKESYADMDCPIRIFDERPSQSQSQNEPPEPDGKGYSRNTVKALSIIRKNLGPAGNAEKVMSFQEMSHKASRRAASSFFFELLVLGTRDCIKVSQAGPHQNIEIRAKDKLWERQRHASVAPSVVSEA